MKMKNLLLCTALFVSLLIPQLSFASGEHGVIVSNMSSSVELRDYFTSDGAYLGYYYVGTEAQLLESDPEGEWVIVEIGTKRGYIPSENFSFDRNSVTPKWKQAVVNIGANETLSVREEANERAAISGAVQRGVVVTVMGETEKHWCYIKADTLYGYLPADKLLIGTTTLPDEPAAPQPTAAPQTTNVPGQTNNPLQTQAPATTNPPPVQGNYGTAFVTAQSSKRVNLRSSASASSRSMGLYYVGTQVQCLSDPNREWVNVSIGNRNGYMKSEYLYQGEVPLVSRQPSAIVSNGSKAVSLRRGPSSSSAVEVELYKGDVVTVLGETDTSWSYIYTGSNYGYVMSKYLAISDGTSPSVTPRPSPVPSTPNNTQQANYTMNHYMPSPYIDIQYPQFTDEKLNTLILDKLSRMKENIAENATMIYSCAVTLNNDKMVSIVFWGGGEVVDGMHESTDLQTLNIDVKAYQELTLQDMYNVNGDFEKVFLNKAYYPSAPQTSYDAASFAEMLMLQTPAYNSVSSFSIGVVQCFLKPDGIVLSMPSVHATGNDHFEGQLNYSDIQSFYRLQENVW